MACLRSYPQCLVIRFRLSPKTFFDLAIVDAKELIGTGSHVDMIGLPLGALLGQKTIDGIVNRLRLEKTRHNEEQSFPEAGRSTFRSLIAFALELARLIHARIHACKGRKGFPMIEPGNIPDLSNQLRSEGRSNTTHAHDSTVFRQGGSKLIHFLAGALHIGGDDIELLDAHQDHLLVLLFFRKYWDKLF